MKILTLLIGLLMISLALAVPVPYVIGGKVTANGKVFSGIEVKIENERAIQSITLKTNNFGEFLLSDGAKYIDAKDGDMIKVSVAGEIQRFKLTSDPVLLTFELANIPEIPEECPACETCPTCPNCDCPDCEAVNLTILFVVLIIGFGLGALVIWLIKR